jgi:hypothetical protein
MNAWTWVLTGLCIAGVALPIIGALVAVRLVFRVRSRIPELRHARLFTSLESLRLQGARLQLLAQRAAAVSQRAQTAIETIRSAAGASGYTRMHAALQAAGAEISALITALR